MNHSTHMKNLCAELKQRVKEEKDRRKALSKEERTQLRDYRREFNERIEEKVRDKIEELRIQKDIRSALKEWAECALHVWDTRNAPSNIFELEAASELPYSHKKWLH